MSSQVANLEENVLVEVTSVNGNRVNLIRTSNGLILPDGWLSNHVVNQFQTAFSTFSQQRRARFLVRVNIVPLGVSYRVDAVDFDCQVIDMFCYKSKTCLIMRRHFPMNLQKIQKNS